MPLIPAFIPCACRALHLHGSYIAGRGVVCYTQQRGLWGGQHDSKTGPDPKLLVPAGDIMGNTCIALGVYTGSWLLTGVLGGWLPPQLSCCCWAGVEKPTLSLPVWVDS